MRGGFPVFRRFRMTGVQGYVDVVVSDYAGGFLLHLFRLIVGRERVDQGCNFPSITS